MATPHEDPDPSLPDDISYKIGQQLHLTLVELARLWEVALRVRQRSELLGTLAAAAQDVLVDVGRKLDEMMWAQLPDHGHRLIVSSPPNVTG